MVNEASIIELYGINNLGDGRTYTIANATAVSYGTVMVLGSDPRTAIAASATLNVPAGIASSDKEASDGKTRISVYTNGIADMIASGAIVLGAHVVATANNYVRMANAADEASSFSVIFGTCEETATDGEIVAIRFFT